MDLTYDNNKRQKTLEERGLDFDDAGEVFEGRYFSKQDIRRNYGEVRHVSIGMSKGHVVVVVWTRRRGTRRIISMRKADQDERGVYLKALE